MTEILTSAQMRSIERAAIESGQASGLDLMEYAGQGVVDAVLAQWPQMQKTPRCAVVLCGPGNNGGDGFVIARLLAARGWMVEVFFVGLIDKLPPDARMNYDRWHGGVHPVSEFLARSVWDCDLVIDALFGTGLTRSPEGLAALFERMKTLRDGAATRPVCVAVDIPSGLCADSGRVFTSEPGEPAAVADLTVSFHAAKLGHVLAEGPDRCGKLVIVDIGLVQSGAPSVVKQVMAPDWRLLNKGAGHKFSYGHALILSGGAGRTGAARLAARAALRVGAGLVTLGVPPAAQQEVACQVTAIMLRRVTDGAGLSDVLQDGRLNAVGLGPALGLDDHAAGLIAATLAAGRATVLDADALTLLAGDRDLWQVLHPGCVLTPHGGEFARLFPDIAADLAELPLRGPIRSKVDATRDAAKRAGCVVLYKGADTVVAAPDGRCAVHAAAYDQAAPWLATAGSGDVLTGLITGLLARGMSPFEAAQTGAWLHAAAARRAGPGLIAEDLPEAIPAVFRDLQNAVSNLVSGK